MIQPALFDLPTSRAPRTRQTLPPQSKPSRYGLSNPSLFASAPRAPAPRRAALPPPYPIAQKDTFSEWVDAHTWEHHEVLHELERLPNDYFASCGYIRSQRPRTSGPALQFWTAPISRAHALNALMNRGGRSIVQLHKDCDLPEHKIYDYTSHWKMAFNRPDANCIALLVDSAGNRHNVRIQELHREDGTATVRIQGYQLTVRAAFDTRQRIYRVSQVLDLDATVYITYAVAGKLANLTPGTLRHILQPDLMTERGTGLLRLSTFERVQPRHLWYTTLEKAMELTNPCRCIFFDHHDRKCGLNVRRPLPDAGTAEYACEDHRS
jgi:hypothetical protein